MSFQLVIAEKPSVARSIAAVIGATEKQNGYWQGGGYLVSWCIGHLVSFAEAGQYDEKYCKWRYEDLPILPQPWQFIVPDEKKQQFEIVRSLLNRPDVDSVTAATDAGREGELIFRFVYQMAGCTQPVKRLWISSMEDAAIREGFANLRPDSDYDALYQSALCRAKADWLVGINATRLFSVLYHKTLTVGRVQTPTLKMLVDRDAKILRFQKEKYYTVGIQSGSLKAGSGRIADAETANSLKEKCTGTTTVCTSVKREKKTEQPPKLYDLTTLQREVNRLFGFTAKQTLDYAQQLYEKKLLTYPRTDSQYLTEDMGQTVRHLVSDLLGLLPFAQRLVLTPDVSRVLNSNKVSDHHAIIPTGEPAESLAGEERALFLLIATAYCLQFHPPMRYEAQKIAVALGDTRWEASGRRLLEAGWTALSRDDDDSDEQEQELLPLMEQGDAVRCRNAESVRKKTSPPSRFSEGSLIDAMAHVHLLVKDGQAKATLKESKGLGTEATRANIIETLKERGYLVAEKKSIVSTPLGQEIIDLTPPALKDPITTAAWEDQLEAIAQGKGSLDAFLSEQKRLLPTLLAPILERKASPAHVCPDCGAALQRRKRKKDGSWFWSCSAYPDCKTILPDDNGKPGSPRPKPTLSEHACKVCGKPLVLRSSAKGKFYGCSDYPRCKQIYPVGENGAPVFEGRKGRKEQ